MHFFHSGVVRLEEGLGGLGWLNRRVLCFDQDFSRRDVCLLHVVSRTGRELHPDGGQGR
jgi:hypothetical protein